MQFFFVKTSSPRVIMAGLVKTQSNEVTITIIISMLSVLKLELFSFLMT